MQIFRFSTIRTLDEVLSWLLWANRVFGGMFAIFAGIAVSSPSVGIYSVVVVCNRAAHAGNRHPHGAWRAARAVVVDDDAIEDRSGCARPRLGLAAAFVLLGLMGGLLVGRFGQDPLTLAVSAGFLLVVSVISMLWPIWRATSRSPVAALRYE